MKCYHKNRLLNHRKPVKYNSHLQALFSKTHSDIFASASRILKYYFHEVFGKEKLFSSPKRAKFHTHYDPDSMTLKYYEAKWAALVNKVIDYMLEHVCSILDRF